MMACGNEHSGGTNAGSLIAVRIGKEQILAGHSTCFQTDNPLYRSSDWLR